MRPTDLFLRVTCMDNLAAMHDVVDCVNMELLRLAENGKINDTNDSGWAWTTYQPWQVFAIVNTTERDDDGHELLWSNAEGWTRENPDLFAPDEITRVNLPMGGAWVPYGWSPS